MSDAEAQTLPIEPYLPAIRDAILEEGALVLSAEPGAGKTSLVPRAVYEALAPARVLVMEPRRIAAISAAARIAELWGSRLGEDVGYRVRGDSRTGPRARVETVTPGVLIRMLQDDPALEGIGCVVLDEFHERSAQADLALAFLRQSRSLRPELGLLAMSATIDSAKAAASLGAVLIEAPGRSFPIETRYSGPEEGPGLERALARAALDLTDEAGGDVLVFLPGVAEIARAAADFTAAGASRTRGDRPEAFVLHGSLPLEEQRRLMSPAPGAPPRAIFATSVAETSLTVPRVRAVVDSGLARLSRFQPRAGLNRLVTEREALDRADQRRGRAGRLGPGICLRAWPASEALALRTEPELSRAELSAIVLEASLWGCRGRLGLDWLDPPPEGAWNAGKELLEELGALAADFSPTVRGRRMAALGTEPRLAALVLRGAEAGEAWTACLAAAFLSERGPSDRGGPGGRDSARDIVLGLEALATGGDRGYGVVRAEALRLARSAGILPGGRVNSSALGPLLAAAFPDRVAERIEYLGPSATFRLPAGRSLRATGGLSQSPWIVALEADAGSAEGRVYSACALGEAEALAALEGRAIETVEAEWKGLEVRIQRSRRVGAIILGTRPESRLSKEELALLLASRIASAGLGILPWEGGASEALARLRYFAAGSAALDETSLSDIALAESAAVWLGAYILTEGGPLLDTAALRRAVLALAPPGTRSRMDREVPERIHLPSGSSRPIAYGGAGGPLVEARVQEFFGLSEHPKVGGRPLVLRLLDPGGKPLQVTSDLPGFWKGSWAQARKELRGRYPKHDWPEDPAAAAPTRSGVKRRGAAR
jgi:ATP-dependent helicase HrpB